MLFRDISEPAEEEIDKRYQVHGPIIDVSDRLLEKPIVLLAQGTEDAIFSVTLQVIHSDQGLVSAVSLSENV